ncbi:hypothetical protein JFU37_03595 [Pseudomonas sp. TH41]|uniref:hypothetical protein n=1 Tax=Pseudomonas sp. TH41 TaxID=2796405 RepID=UPI00191477F8|nr:hypothetical protein [Pseudomonas sp. TH41]MBK5351608.1 hypothetical protein [Pseudomonas sp. TH41]
MKSITMSDVHELAKRTGNSPQAVLTELFAEGYQIVEEAPQPRGNPLTSSKDALALWKASKQKVADELYKGDPLVRQMMDVESAYNGFGTQPHKSVLVRDEAGNITGTTKSMLTGATQSEQAELMAAIRAKYNQGE